MTMSENRDVNTDRTFPMSLKRPLKAYLPASCAAIPGLVLTLGIIVGLAQNPDLLDAKLGGLLVISIILSVLGIYFFLSGIMTELTLLDQGHVCIKSLRGSGTYLIKELKLYYMTNNGQKMLLVKDQNQKLLCAIESQAKGWKEVTEFMSDVQRRARLIDLLDGLSEKVWYCPAKDDSISLKVDMDPKELLIRAADSEALARLLAENANGIKQFTLQELEEVTAELKENNVLVLCTESDKRRYSITKEMWHTYLDAKQKND